MTSSSSDILNYFERIHGSDHQWDYFKPIINGKFIYKRILIKKIIK